MFAALVKSGYMLEHPSISQYFGPNQSDNLWSADNQQERLAAKPESSETIRQTSFVYAEEDDEMVRSAWRHAECGRDARTAIKSLMEVTTTNGPKVTSSLP